MTQTIGIEVTRDPDPSVLAWAEAYAGTTMRKALDGLLDIAEKAKATPERILADAGDIGRTGLAAITKPAA
jgi:hypothetical protein